MEFSKTDLRPIDLSRNILDSLPVLRQTKPKLDPERAAQQLLFDEVTRLAGDWLEASGGQPIAQNQYDNLFSLGYASHSSEDILKVFHDWQDYQLVSCDFLAYRREKRQQRDSELLDRVQAEVVAGSLPTILLYGTDRHDEKSPTSRSNGELRMLLRYEFSGHKAPDQVILERYSRYTVADHLLKSSSDEKQISNGRKINIALGFNVDTGKALSSYNSTLKNSRSSLLDADIERVAEELRLYDYVYPHFHKVHLQELRRAAEGSPRIPIGELAVKNSI